MSLRLTLNEIEEGGDSPDQSSDFSPPSSPSTPTTHAMRVISRRKRTLSESEKIMAGPTHYGQMIEFCREKGHGFVRPVDGGEQLFVHISDIEGELVPKAGDEVSYKLCPIPPKNQRFAAVHVQIINSKSGVQHETWDSSGRKVDLRTSQS